MGEILMNKIDITTTATIRPEILDKTLRSFTRCIFHERDRYKFIINIDPIGDKGKKKEEVLEVAKKYFNNVICNFPNKPGFTKAVMWLWSHTDSDYVFHLEDDWFISHNINIDNMVHILDIYSKICSVRLSKGQIAAAKKVIKPISCPYIQSEDIGKFQLFPRLSLNPTLFRGDFVREAAKVMTIKLNPESQLVKRFAIKKEKKGKGDCNSQQIEELLSKWDHSVLMVNNGRPVVKDIGLMWRNKHGIQRKYDFMYWK